MFFLPSKALCSVVVAVPPSSPFIPLTYDAVGEQGADGGFCWIFVKPEQLLEP